MDAKARFFVAGLAVAAVAFVGRPAQAAWQRYSATGCRATVYGRMNVDFDVIPSLTAGMINFDDNHGVDLYCPVDDDNLLSHQGATTLNVHVHDGSTTDVVWAEACGTTLGQSGYACGGYYGLGTGSAFTGDATLTLDLDTIWHNTVIEYDYAFVYVYLPAHQPSSASNVRGFFEAS